jgi:CHAP domain
MGQSHGQHGQMRRIWSCWALKAVVRASVVVCATFLLAVPAASAGDMRQNVLSVAEREIGYHDYGDFCTKFGPCETWCSLFVTWVWARAGVPVPSLAFTGYLYDWARASTYVLGPRSVPTPGDAVLFGSGPASVYTSLHTGIVEAVYPKYLITIEGDSLHAVRRYVVPLKDPELVGEPGPIYGYASPVGAGGESGVAARSAAVPAWPALPTALIARQDSAPPVLSEHQRLVRAIAALRAFQHMPFRTAQVSINWTGLDNRGLVEVRVSTGMPLSYARRAWRAFLGRFDDAGHAYTVSFQAPPDPPVSTSPPSISGSASVGQTLTESHGSWTNDPTAYTYQWEDCDSSGQSCSAISGATGQTYAPTATDLGHTIRVQEVASNPGGAGQPDTSAATSVVEAD